MTIPKPMLVITAIIFATLLAACSFSTEDLAEEVKSDMEERFEGERIEIESLILTHKGGNEYKGVLETQEPYGEFTYSVDVIYDGQSFSWEITN